MPEPIQPYAVPTGVRLPDLLGGLPGVVEARVGPPAELREVYLDAPDLRLARAGVRARLRTGGAAPAWRLDRPGGLSVVLPGTGPAATEATAEVTPPAEVTDLLTAWLRGAPLHPVAELATTRTTITLHGPAGEQLATVVDDAVTVAAPADEAASRCPRLVTVEPGALSEEARAAVGKRLAAAAAEPVPGGVLAAVLGDRVGAPDDLPAVPAVGPGDPAALVVALSLRTGLRRLVGVDLGVRRGEDDAVHQMRVACRRMRSDLRTFGPLVEPAWANGLRAELSWLAGELGAARDLEVLRARFAHTAVADPLAPIAAEPVAALDAALARQEEAAQVELLAALRSTRYVRLLDTLIAAAAAPVTTEAAEASCAQALPPLVTGAWARLARRAGRLRRRDEDERWHQVRILAKRARYAAEAVAPVLGDGPRQVARSAEKVQELLGEHQDAVVAAAAVLTLARTSHRDDAGFCLAAGQLAERERAQVRELRRQFPRRWRQVSRPKQTRWLSECRP